MTGPPIPDPPAIPRGQCILVVEDEMLVMMMIEDMLTDLGYQVITASRVKKALNIAATATIDCAILDVNVDGATIFIVAQGLRRRGIPFVFSTGYTLDNLPAEYRDTPLLSKPYTSRLLKQTIDTALAAGGSAA